jgi:hypothetical protein
MIQQVQLVNFKRFKDETFDLEDSIILAGPNNTGKTTLLQALTVWDFALRKWWTKRGSERKSKATERRGVAITRKEFASIPLRDMNLLWTDRSTHLSKGETSKPGAPRYLEIRIEGTKFWANNAPWSVGLEFAYRYADVIHVRPVEGTTSSEIHDTLEHVQVVHVPPFSGIGSDETRYDRAYQDLLIGQGKPGDILRNLLLELHQEKTEEWKQLCEDINEIFRYGLLPPEYSDQPYIVCEYIENVSSTQGRRGSPNLDISCAGSGMLQVVMLLSFFYARPASIFLLDEPDAHLHVILQKQVYDMLRKVAFSRGCQLLIATHSEILVDSTSPEKILSFLQHPHKLVDDSQRDQVREAIKRLTSLDILSARRSPRILYVESSDTDLSLLQAWAKVLKHPASAFLNKNPFSHSLKGSHPKEARAHFFALKAVKDDVSGVLILDGDNRGLPEHEISAEGLTILRWKRYEAENYLLHPKALERFLEYSRGKVPDLFVQVFPEKAVEYLKDQLPPTVIKDPLSDHDFLNATPASKKLLPGFFEAAGLSITKNEYYQVAAQMQREEIPGEVREKLDSICEALNLSKDLSLAS